MDSNEDAHDGGTSSLFSPRTDPTPPLLVSAAPGGSGSMSYRDRLIEFYRTYNPAKVTDVDLILESFAGDEENMLLSLYGKYGVDGAAHGFTDTPHHDANGAAPKNHLALDNKDTAELSAAAERQPGKDRRASPLRRARASPVSAAHGGRDAAAAAVKRSADGSKASLDHLHQRLQQLLSSIVQVDPSELFLAGASRDSEEDLAAMLRDMSRFKSLAALFVEESSALVDFVAAAAASGAGAAALRRSHERQDADAIVSGGTFTSKSTLNHENSKAQPLQRPSLQPLDGLQDGAIVMLPPNRSPAVSTSATGRLDESSCVITDRLVQQRRTDGGGPHVMPAFALQPGVYTERVVVPEGVTVELRGGYVGASVELRCATTASGDEEPIILVSKGATLRCVGLRFTHRQPSASSNAVGETLSSAPTVRVMGGTAEFVNCTFDHTGVGVQVEGIGAVLRATDCKFRNCTYAGIYAKHGAVTSLNGCQFHLNASSLRCRGASFSMLRCDVQQSSSDALITHGTVEGSIEACSFAQGTENALLLSPSTTIAIASTSFTAFKMFSVYAAKGADVQLSTCTFSDVGLGSINVPGIL